jgi:apolipoprotein N-acyltransferase
VPLVVPAFVCLVPYALVVERLAAARARWTAAFRFGLVTGALAFALALYWIAFALAIYTKLAFLGYLGALLVLAPICGAGTAAVLVMRRDLRLPYAITLPLAWVSVEMVMMHMSDLAFPWLPLGLAVARVPVLAQAAELSGVHGLSGWIAASNGLLADAWLGRADRRGVALRVAAVGALAAAMWGYGTWRLGDITMRPVAEIAIVQPNVPQEDKWLAQNQNRILGMLVSGSERALAKDTPQLVLWPEAALPGILSNHADWATEVSALAAQSHTPVLFGVLDEEYRAPGQPEYFNAAMLADSLGSIESQRPYHKRELVPVVERVPFLNPRWFANLRFFGGFGRGGDDQAPFSLPFGKVGVLICYESIFPEIARQYRRAGASLVVNITNDAWFGRSLAPWQHEAHLALRAIEVRTGVVRAANTGISAYIDPLGRVHGATEIFTAAERTYRAETTDIRTLFVMLGDWAGWLCVVGTLALLVRARVLRGA